MEAGQAYQPDDVRAIADVAAEIDAGSVRITMQLQQLFKRIRV